MGCRARRGVGPPEQQDIYLATVQAGGIAPAYDYIPHYSLHLVCLWAWIKRNYSTTRKHRSPMRTRGFQCRNNWRNSPRLRWRTWSGRDTSSESYLWTFGTLTKSHEADIDGRTVGHSVHLYIPAGLTSDGL